MYLECLHMCLCVTHPSLGVSQSHTFEKNLSQKECKRYRIIYCISIALASSLNHLKRWYCMKTVMTLVLSTRASNTSNANSCYLKILYLLYLFYSFKSTVTNVSVSHCRSCISTSSKLPERDSYTLLITPEQEAMRGQLSWSTVTVAPCSRAMGAVKEALTVDCSVDRISTEQLTFHHIYCMSLLIWFKFEIQILENSSRTVQSLFCACSECRVSNFEDNNIHLSGSDDQISTS